MKKLFIGIILLISVLTCCSCCPEIDEADRLEIKDNKEVGMLGGWYLYKATIGNHEYLYAPGGKSLGICHYEDCEYCKRMKK